MTGGGVGSINGLQPRVPDTDTAATTSAEDRNSLDIRQRTSVAPSPASLGAVATVKTLADAFDPSAVPSAKFERKGPGYEADGRITWTRPPDARDDLTSTWRALENLVGSLSDRANPRVASDLEDEFTDKPDVSDRDLLDMVRDQRLAEDLLHGLQKAGLDDDSREAQDARALMGSIGTRARLRLVEGQTAATSIILRDAERAYAEQKADAVAFIRAMRPKLPPADSAVRQLEDLYTDLSNDRSLEPVFGARARARLGRDLQTLHELVQAGKRNGWLPGRGQPSADPASRAYMEAKACDLANSIFADVHSQLGNPGADERARDIAEAGRLRGPLAADARDYLAALDRFDRAPKSASFVMPRQIITDALVEAHDTRGREIMDSLPPDYLANLLARGENAHTLADRLRRCSDLLHVSRTGIRRGFWRGLRNLGSRELTSWQAAQVRRTVAMLALSGASRPEIRAVRRELIEEMRAANQQIGVRNRQNVEGSVSILSWDARPFENLSTYTGHLEKVVAGRGATEQRRWLPLTNLHTAMNNASLLLQAGGSASDALAALNHDLTFARNARVSRRSADAPGSLLPSIGAPPRSVLRPALLEDDSVELAAAHPYADVLRASERGASDAAGSAHEPNLATALERIREDDINVPAPQPEPDADDMPPQNPPHSRAPSEIELQLSIKPAAKDPVDDD